MKGKIKFLAVVLTLILLIGASTAIAFAADLGGEGEEPAVATLRIQNFNLSLENAVFMNFKVSSENVENVKDIKLLAWDEAPAEYRKGTETVCLDSEKTEEATGYEVFQYTDLAAKDMTKTVYVCAYVNVDGVETYSEPAKFSIAMYAYLKKNAATSDGELVKLLDAMLAYGAAAQTYFDHRTDFLANATTYQIDVVNGKLEDGFAKGWYPQDASVTLTANAPESGYRFSHWENSAGEQVGTTETLTLTATATEKYTAVYVEAVTYSEGLEMYRLNGRGFGVCGIGTCTDTDIVIPPTYLGEPVTDIWSDAFKNCTNITSVTIPSSVTRITDSAFVGCTNLRSVHISDLEKWCEIYFSSAETNPLYYASNLYINGVLATEIVIPDGTKVISKYAFYKCQSITKVTVGNNVESIGRQAFAGCSNLTDVTIGSGLTTIEYMAFSGCKGLTSVSIPEGTTNIGGYAFYNCVSLENVKLPGTLVNIEGYAFKSCSKLLSIKIPASVVSIGRNAFEDCSSLSSIDFDKNSQLDSIGQYAFEDCSNLTNIIIPDSVTTIDLQAFNGCNNIETITLGKKLVNIVNAFPSCRNIKKIYISDLSSFCKINFSGSIGSVYSAYNKDLYLNGELVKELNIPNDVTHINNNAFVGYSITSVRMSTGVQSIGVSAFAYCRNLTDVIISDSVTNIGSSAFYECQNLTSVEIPNSVISIGSTAFYGCRSLKNIVIPSNVESIGAGVFRECSGLQNAEIQCSMVGIVDFMFRGCSGLRSVIIPNDITSIGKSAFEGCYNLANFTIPKNVVSIGDYAFAACYLFTEIVIPNGVENIGKSVFSYCSGLTSVIIPSSVTNIGEDAFYYCYNLANIIIPESVTNIGRSAFGECKNLVMTVIPSSTTNIEDYAFSGCSSLSTVYYKGTEAEWSEIAINSSGNENLTNAIHYYYSAGMPTTEGNYWCYVNGEVSKWEDVLSVFNMTNTEDSCTLVGVKDKNATSFPIPDCVTVIANSAFSGCTNLEVVVIPDSVTTIEAWAFSRCGNLKSVIFGENVKTIGKGAFQECVALEHVTISNCVVSLGEQAFYGCTNLASITIANSVTSIDALAFYRCSSLSSIYYIGTESEWAQISIGKDNTGITNATIYFYTETQPTTAGNYWHYVDGEPTVW